MPKENMYEKSNRLINEKSPYLLQHAYNPVDWYPWGEEAFEKAKEEDKPIFLSIGYSTCHWCHVMERESFESEEVAELLNKNFIAVKVDREERPDIDSIYMTFCQAFTGSGGWPLTILMTPEKKPFYAGTYFPPKSRYGRPGLMDVLKSTVEAWKNKRKDIISTSKSMAEGIRKYSSDTYKSELDRDILYIVYDDLKNSYEHIYGGFSVAPKFPIPHNIYFLLRYYTVKGDKEALTMAENTLENMCKGGIFDHIGFGFSRYSTDQKWLVPHFEKMLYDNALLAIAYIEAYRITEKELYKETAERIFHYVLSTLVSERGGFFSAEDADSEGEEGKFYLWTVEEVENVLGKEEGEFFCKYYDISKKGNFEGKNIPNLISKNIDHIGKGEISARLNEERIKLFNSREKRVHPFKDDKILTAWNGMMIAALSYGGRILNNNVYLKSAGKSIDFIIRELMDSKGRLLARFRDGESAIPAYVDDYAFLIWGLIEFYEAVFDTKYLEYAVGLTEDMLKLFWDEKDGGFFLYGKDSEELIARPKEIYDGAIPSGNSVAALDLLRMSRITGNTKFEEKALRIFETFGGNLKKNPGAHTFLAAAFMYSVMPSKDIVIVGDVNEHDTRLMIDEINKKFMPFSTIILNDGNEKLYHLIPFLKEQKRINNRVTAYICENYKCTSPVTNIEDFKKLL